MPSRRTLQASSVAKFDERRAKRHPCAGFLKILLLLGLAAVILWTLRRCEDDAAHPRRDERGRPSRSRCRLRSGDDRLLGTNDAVKTPSFGHGKSTVRSSRVLFRNLVTLDMTTDAEPDFRRVFRQSRAPRSSNDIAIAILRRNGKYQRRTHRTSPTPNAESSSTPE